MKFSFVTCASPHVTYLTLWNLEQKINYYYLLLEEKVARSAEAKRNGTPEGC